MRRIPPFAVLLMIVGLAGAVFLSVTKLQPMRQEMYAQAPEQLEAVYMPVMGLETFYADLQWIGMIQELGEMEQSMLDDERGRRMAEYYYKRIDRLTDLSPETAIFYDFGANMISNIRPERAVALLKKGDRFCSKKTYSRSHFRAAIITNFIRGRIDKDEEPQRYRRLTERAMKALENAIEIGDHPIHVEKAWMRKKIELDPTIDGDDDLAVLVAWKEHLLDKYRTSMSSDAEGVEDLPVDAAGEEGEEAPGGGEPDGGRVPLNEVGYLNTEVLSDLRDNVMHMAQSQAAACWEVLQSDPDNAEQRRRLQRVRAIFNEIAPPGHYSMVSLKQYDAGDLYDPHTGTAVKPYGISYAAYDRYGAIVPFKGPYCHMTGESREESEAAWNSWWDEHKPNF